MKKFKFKARLEAADRGGAYVLFPYDTEQEFSTKGKIPVKATLDGIAYQGSLVKYAQPQHMLGMLKSIREQLGKSPGDTIDVVLWKDESQRTVEIPPDFHELMKNEGLFAGFEKLSFTHRKEYCRWITEAKKQDTRAKRLQKAVEMLRAGVKTPG